MMMPEEFHHGDSNRQYCDKQYCYARNSYKAHNYRTQVYYSAYSQFQKILESEPNNPAANFMLGITAYKQAVLSELIEAFLELFDVNISDESKKK